jgi:outer membrane protein, heavy metal efflux system
MIQGSLLRSVAAACLLITLGGCATTQAAKRPSTPGEWRAEMQPPLGEREEAALAEGLTLVRAVQLGAARNPMVAAARERWLARIHVEPQAVTPPDPMIGGQWMLNEGTVNIDSMDWSVGPELMIPWPQKLWAEGRVAAVEADVARLRYEAALRDLIIDIKAACYELYYLDQAIPVVEKIETMLRNYAVLAYSELTVGRTQLNEAFRAESQAAQLAYDRILLIEQRAAQAERLRALLNLPPQTVVGPVRHAPVYAVSADLEELHGRAEGYAQILKIQGLETQRAAFESYLARLARIPDITIGASYSVFMEAMRPVATDTANGMTTEMGESSTRGKGPLMGMLSMNLPIFEWRNRAFIRERQALEQAMRLEALSELNEVRAGVAQAYFLVRLTERLIALYDETLLPQATAIMDQAERFFRSDQASFSNLIETTLAYQNFTLARLRAIADHGQAIGQLERVLGTTAEPRPATRQDDLRGVPSVASVPSDPSSAGEHAGHD